MISQGHIIDNDIINTLKTYNLMFMHLDMDTHRYLLEKVPGNYAGSLFVSFEKYRDDDPILEDEPAASSVPIVNSAKSQEGGIHPVTGKSINPKDPGFIREINHRKIESLIAEEGQSPNLQKFTGYHEEWNTYIKDKIPKNPEENTVLLNQQEMGKFANKLKNEIIENPSFPKKYITTFLNLLTVTEKKTDSLLYEHLIEVCLFSSIVGAQEFQSDEDINSLLLGGLLHDCGMLKIPGDILNKEAPLTNQELAIIHKHPLYGGMIIKNCFKDETPLNKKIFAITLQHHWNNKGNGYYNQAKFEKQVHFIPHSKIVQICDTYAALIEKRPYRTAMEPFEAVQEMIKMKSKNLFDGHFFNIFLNTIGRIPNSTYVRVLDTKLSESNIKDTIPGIVCEQNVGHPNIPNVKVLDGSGKVLNLNDLSTRYKIMSVYYKGKFVRF